MPSIRFSSIFLLLLAAISAHSQCVATFCQGAPITLTAINDATNAAFAPGFTVNWTIPEAFTGQGTSVATISAPATVGQLNVSYTVTDPTGCTSVVNGCVTITPLPVVNLDLPDICPGSSVPVSGGTPGGGVYTFNGNPITQLDDTMIGGVVIYSITANGCNGSTTDSFNLLPAPTGSIQAN